MSRISRRVILVVAFAIGWCPPFSALADTGSITVNDAGDADDANPGDGTCATAAGVCTLRAAMTEVDRTPYPLPHKGVDVPAMTIILSAPLNARASIRGAGQELTVIDGNGAVQVFPRWGGELSNLTVRNGLGDYGGCVHVAVGNSVMLSSVTVENCQAMDGGGIYVEGGVSFEYPQSILRLSSVTIRDNVATRSGGGLYNMMNVSGDGVVITGNRADDGGGIYSHGSNFILRINATLRLDEFTISGNVAHSGGGIHADAFELTNGVISDNVAECCGRTGDPTGGGGIWYESLLPTDPNAKAGVMTGVTLKVNRATSAGGYGGGMAVRRGKVALNRVSFFDNSATFGAALYNGPFVYCEDVPRTVGVDVTMSGNHASPEDYARGGAIYNGACSQLSLTNSTVAFNSAPAGGGIENALGVVTLRGTILAENVGTSGSPDCEGTLGSYGHNLVGSAAGCDITPAGGDWFGVEPKLLPLVGEPPYHPLRLDSPALDAGDDVGCPALDQRGMARPQGAHCDIGAVEFGDAAGLGDLGGDGRADLLWRSVAGGARGALQAWTMNGVEVTPTSLGAASPNWQLQRLGDFNGDGRSDLLWRERDAGTTYLWFMDGTTVTGGGFTASSAASSWQVQGVGDFDGDGKDDLLWRNGTLVYVWMMNGTAIAGSGFLDSVDTGWQVQAVADFGGDGKADILWREGTSGRTYLWTMDGLSVQGQGFLESTATPDWRLVGTADLNGDGRADLVWRHRESGAVYAWLLNGTHLLGQGFLPRVDLDWDVEALGDFDGDGKADLLWRYQPSGATYVWFLSGTEVVGQGYTSLGLDPSWQVRHPR